MEKKTENVIFSYTDAEALADGVLVSVDASPVNRVTRAVFDHLAPQLEFRGRGPLFDLSSLRGAISAVLALKPDEGGWRRGSYEGKELWLVPNEVEGLTLMFPEDY